MAAGAALPTFLTGKRLLSTQSFRELFRAETLPPDGSLEIRALAMLFTDLKASTQLYERVGDLKALALVREHFREHVMRLRARRMLAHGLPEHALGGRVVAAVDRRLHVLGGIRCRGRAGQAKQYEEQHQLFHGYLRYGPWGRGTAYAHGIFRRLSFAPPIQEELTKAAARARHPWTAKAARSSAALVRMAVNVSGESRSSDRHCKAARG